MVIFLIGIFTSWAVDNADNAWERSVKYWAGRTYCPSHYGLLIDWEIFTRLWPDQSLNKNISPTPGPRRGFYRATGPLIGSMESSTVLPVRGIRFLCEEESVICTWTIRNGWWWWCSWFFTIDQSWQWPGGWGVRSQWWSHHSQPGYTAHPRDRQKEIYWLGTPSQLFPSCGVSLTMVGAGWQDAGAEP